MAAPRLFRGRLSLILHPVGVPHCLPMRRRWLVVIRVLQRLIGRLITRPLQVVVLAVRRVHRVLLRHRPVPPCRVPHRWWCQVRVEQVLSR